MQAKKKRIKRQSISDSSERQSNDSTAKVTKRRLTRIRLIRVKEIHPDAPESPVIHKHDENEKRKFGPQQTDVNVKPEGI